MPRWRGAAPVQRAIQAGDGETGVSIMVMDSGIDTGRVLLQKACAIHGADTALSLSERLAALGGECLLDALAGLEDASIDPRDQDEEGASYAHKISKREAEIDWDTGAEQIERTIRAFNPAPVAHTCLNDVKVRVWEARTLDAGAAPRQSRKYHKLWTGRTRCLHWKRGPAHPRPATGRKEEAGRKGDPQRLSRPFRCAAMNLRARRKAGTAGTDPRLRPLLTTCRGRPAGACSKSVPGQQ